LSRSRIFGMTKFIGKFYEKYLYIMLKLLNFGMAGRKRKNNSAIIRTRIRISITLITLYNRIKCQLQSTNNNINNINPSFHCKTTCSLQLQTITSILPFTEKTRIVYKYALDYFLKRPLEPSYIK